jgi:hypothetical protein
MTNGSENEAAYEKHRVVFAQHRKCGGCARGNRPHDLAAFKRPQEAIRGDGPGRQKNSVGIEALGVKLVGRQQHHKQQHDNPLIAPYEAPGSQIHRPQCNCRIGQRHQLERPIGEWKGRRPDSRNPSHQWGMFGVTPLECASKRPRLQGIRVQITAEIGDDQKRHPDCHKSYQQKGHGPSRLDAVQPTQKRPAPTCRRNIRTRSHRRKRKIRSQCNFFSENNTLLGHDPIMQPPIRQIWCHGPGTYNFLRPGSGTCTVVRDLDRRCG